MPRFDTSDGLSLYFEDTGTGTPVLCLAGLTRNARDFDFLAPHLGNHRMIALDYRGRGKSEYDPDHANYTVMREAQDVVELLDHLGVERTFIVGTSRGGLIAMMLAAGNAQRLMGVVLNDVGPVVSQDGIARIMDYVGRPPGAATTEDHAAQLEAAMSGDFPGVPLSRWRQVSAAQHDETDRGLALRYDPNLRQALTEQLEAGPPGDLWPLFDAMHELTVGVIRGANSDILTADTFDHMRYRHPGAIAQTVPDRGHVPFLDEPGSLKVIHAVLDTA